MAFIDLEKNKYGRWGDRSIPVDARRYDAYAVISGETGYQTLRGEVRLREQKGGVWLFVSLSGIPRYLERGLVRLEQLELELISSRRKKIRAGGLVCTRGKADGAQMLGDFFITEMLGGTVRIRAAEKQLIAGPLIGSGRIVPR